MSSKPSFFSRLSGSLGKKILFAVLAAALIYPIFKMYSVPFAYMQEIFNYDSDANLKTWSVMSQFIREDDALVIMQTDGNYTLQIYEGSGVYAYRYIPAVNLETEFANLIEKYGRVWVFIYNGVLSSGSIFVPKQYQSVLAEQYQSCFTLPLFFGETVYLEKNEKSEMARALFSQQLLNYISDIAKEIDYRDLAIFFQKAGQYENAKNVLEKALFLFPNSALLYRTLAECYVSSSNLEAYDKIYHCNLMANALSRAVSGKAHLTALFQNAIFTSRKGYLERARRLYLSLIDLFGNQPDPYLESQVRRYFTKDVLLPMGDTNEAISQLLVDINAGAQDMDYSYNLLLDILDNCGYGNAAVSLGYGYFKYKNHQDVKSAMRYGAMAVKYGTLEQLKEAVSMLSERNRYNPLLVEKLRLEKEWYRDWTNATLSHGLVPFGGN